MRLADVHDQRQCFPPEMEKHHRKTLLFATGTFKQENVEKNYENKAKLVHVTTARIHNSQSYGCSHTETTDYIITLSNSLQ